MLVYFGQPSDCRKREGRPLLMQAALFYLPALLLTGAQLFANLRADFERAQPRLVIVDLRG